MDLKEFDQWARDQVGESEDSHWKLRDHPSFVTAEREGDRRWGADYLYVFRFADDDPYLGVSIYIEENEITSGDPPQVNWVGEALKKKRVTYERKED